MDAIEFVKQLRRMDVYGGRKYSVFNDSPEDVVAEVEEWAKKNPVKTRQSEFLKQWPNASADEDGVLFCPKTVDSAHICYCKDKGCIVCRREFWMQEVE